MSVGFSFIMLAGFAIFFIVFVFFIVILVKSVTTWSKNNHSPLLTVDVTVVAKRDDLHVHGGAIGSDAHMHSATSYTDHYVTFQVESGDRIELMVPESEYGYIVEGDKGKVSFKGTRFISFERKY